MKATGIVRKMDELGRIVIPMEIRKTFEINEGDPMEIYTDQNGEIVLKKYIPQNSCVICGNLDDVIDYKNKKVCSKCAAELGGVKLENR